MDQDDCPRPGLFLDVGDDVAPVRQGFRGPIDDFVPPAGKDLEDPLVPAPRSPGEPCELGDEIVLAKRFFGCALPFFDIRDDLFVALAPQVRMRHGMVADLVPVLYRLPPYVRIGFQAAARYEECAFDAVFAQQVQHFDDGLFAPPVVDRQAYVFLFYCAYTGQLRFGPGRPYRRNPCDCRKDKNRQQNFPDRFHDAPLKTDSI